MTSEGERSVCLAKGFLAGSKGQPESNNPYLSYSADNAKLWHYGWILGNHEYQRREMENSSLANFQERED